MNQVYNYFKTIAFFSLCCDVTQLSEVREQLHSRVHGLDRVPISSDLRWIPYDIIVLNFALFHLLQFSDIS